MRLLVFGHNDWWTWAAQGFCGRNAALMRALARRPEVEAIAVVDTPRYRRRSRRPLEHRRDDASAVGPKTVAVRYDFPLPLPAGWRFGRMLNERLARGALARRVGAACSGDEPMVVWVADPRAATAAARLATDLLVFDAIDDWRFLRSDPPKTIAAGYATLAKRAGLSFAVNESLIRRLGLKPPAVVLPNALEWSEWQDVTPDDGALSGLPGPRVVYVGTLQQRVDFELAASVAAALPGVSFALIGPVVEGFAVPAGPANLRVLPPVPHARVPGLLAAADACIVPHRRDGMAETMDPLKVYEYLAAGRPVVGTVAPPYAPLQPFVRVAADATGFAAALREELANDNESRRAARRAAVSAETWDARAARVVELIAAARSPHGSAPGPAR